MELLCVNNVPLLRRVLRFGSDRLENEHLGNMDSYRVTRDVPLPYSFNDQRQDDDNDEDEDEDPFRPSGVIWIGPLSNSSLSKRSSVRSDLDDESSFGNSAGASPPPDYVKN
jgi:hypothetical protein